jgi:hypothetical protein
VFSRRLNGKCQREAPRSDFGVFTVISVASPEQDEPGSLEDANPDFDSNPPVSKARR